MEKTESTTSLKSLFKTESEASHKIGCFITDLNNAAASAKKPIVLLSCSHIFHVKEEIYY